MVVCTKRPEGHHSREQQLRNAPSPPLPLRLPRSLMCGDRHCLAPQTYKSPYAPVVQLLPGASALRALKSMQPSPPPSLVLPSLAFLHPHRHAAIDAICTSLMAILWFTPQFNSQFLPNVSHCALLRAPY
jgi:hypothetical protein